MKPCACFLVLFLCLALSAGPIEDLKPGEWYAVPNSQLRASEKKPAEYMAEGMSTAEANTAYSTYQYNMGLDALIHNWNSGDYDPIRDRMIVWGGGHNGYGGNEVYIFDVKKLAWERVTDPTINPNRCHDVNPDGTPTSRHTNAGVAYIAHSDKYFSLGGARDCSSGGASGNTTWIFDFSLKKWTNMNPSGSIPYGRINVLATYDPSSTKLYFINDGFYGYEVEKNLWTKYNSTGRGDYAGGQTIDPKRRLFFQIGSGSPYIHDLKTPTITRTGLNSTGTKYLESVGAPGLAYDPVSDKIVGWYYGKEVYTLDPETLVWQTHAPAPTNTVNLTGEKLNAGGVYGRFRYMPNYNAFIAVIDVDLPVFIYKFTDAPKAPQWYLDLYGIGSSGTAVSNSSEMKSPLTVSPNPFSGKTTIQLKGNSGRVAIFDLRGRMVAAFNANPGTSKVTWNAQNHAPGIYVAQARAGGKKITRRLFLVK
jgi:hypothetical protein